MTIATLALFLAMSVAIVTGWNRFFRPVPHGVTALFLIIVGAYEATALVTPRVEMPDGLAAAIYPWKRAAVTAPATNTGIVISQLVPWTRVAREAIVHGEWPLWNR